MKSLLLSFAILIGICMLLTPYALPGDDESPEVLLNNIDAIQALEIANQWKWSKKNIQSYVNSLEIVFKFSNKKVKRIPLPEEKMVVAVAPYINHTHRWIVHYMSSCQGELTEKEFDVRATDQNGHVLFDGKITTLRNGFFELWLPRNRRIELRIQGLNRTARGTIETFYNSNTCITTFQLK